MVDFRYLQQQHMVNVSNLNQNAEHYLFSPLLVSRGLVLSRLFVFGVCRPVLVIDVTVVINCKNVCYIQPHSGLFPVPKQPASIWHRMLQTPNSP